ncbi:hypothetical protein CUJ83_00710 [Methanocella sp. CWC-04]|uniref:Uncharacterized protein n=1 Tax=Methanooceanicella nereidis TaxID=2052831 RepID=A0AAP2W5W1_9EURY|nr:hypothetical protein [Methanocella sp. CWC-04]MCD1293516.1 hypothetical protein [Methanocella sp. CWC-04]
MNYCSVDIKESSKNSYYQIIVIDDLDYNKINDKLLKYNLTINKIDLKSRKNSYLIESTEMLGRYLREFKNYSYYIFNNSEFIELIVKMNNNEYILEYIDYLGLDNEEEINEIDELLRFNNIIKLVEILKTYNVQINSQDYIKRYEKISIFKSGLIYTNVNLTLLIKLLEKIM